MLRNSPKHTQAWNSYNWGLSRQTLKSLHSRFCNCHGHYFLYHTVYPTVQKKKKISYAQGFLLMDRV